MMKKMMLLSAAVFSSAVFAGEIYKAKAGDLLPVKAVEQLEGGVLRAAGKTLFLHAKTPFAVDPAKKYVISGEFRFLGTLPRSFNAGLMPMTEKNMPISSVCIDAVAGTETVLAAPAEAGDTVLKVADALRWNNKRPSCGVAFNVKDNRADLPNFSCIGMKTGSVNKNGDDWEIRLGKPLPKAYAAGTRVRQHLFGGTFIYSIAKFKKDLSGEWQKFSGTVTGMTENTRSDTKFWPGTAKARVIVLTMGGADDSAVEFRGLKVEEIE
ncbi:MAG: hypothetical protein IJS01_01565 [Lentisphaeria bacterium]|nr:hypothetical protein [Lentisphaeria bacterium]